MNESFGDGGPAFPRPAFSQHAEAKIYCYSSDAQEGMSLRDWFAGRVLPVLISDDLKPDAELATVAYRLADAMLAERSVIHAEFKVTPDSAVAKAAADLAKWAKEAQEVLVEIDKTRFGLAPELRSHVEAVLAAHPGDA